MMETNLSAKTERVLIWGLAAYAVATLVSMAVMSIATGLLLVALWVALGGWRGLASSLRSELKSPYARLYLWVASAFALACVISLIVGKFFPLSFDGKHSVVHLFKDPLKLWYLFWPLLLATGLRALSEAGRMKVLRAWIVAFGVLSLIGFLQFWTGWPRVQPIPGLPGHFHTTLFLGHHLSVASVFIFPFFAALDFSRFPASARSLGLRREWLIAIVAVGAAALFTTYSRTLWIALPLSVLFWGVLRLPRKIVIPGVVLLFLAGVLATQHPWVQFRLQQSMGISDRVALWRTNLEFLRLRPVTGVGWLHNNELSGHYLLSLDPSVRSVFSGHAHNNFIDALGGTGALGASAWLFWCVTVIWLAWRARKQEARGFADVFATGLVCAWLAFQINGLTQLNFWEAKVTHQIMLMVGWTLLWMSRRERESA